MLYKLIKNFDYSQFGVFCLSCYDASARWLRRARSFIESAKLLVQNQTIAPIDIGPSIGLLVWQGVENSLKAVCSGHSFPISHDLSRIMNHIRSNNLMDKKDLSDLTRSAAVVTGSSTYNDTRYPVNDMNWWERMPRSKLSQVTDAAKFIHEICSRKIQSS